MYPPPPHVVRCGFLTNPPSPSVRPRGLRMAPYAYHCFVFSGEKYYFDVGILLGEMNLCKSNRIQTMSNKQNSAKLRWLDAILPSMSDFFKLRRIDNPSVARDFEVNFSVLLQSY